MTTERRIMTWGNDPEAVASVGGPTIPFTATVALKIGDVVSVSTSGAVTKTAVTADGAKFVGVVVGGGGSMGRDYSLLDSASVGLALVAAAKVAEVQVAGIAYVVTGGAVAVGDKLIIDTTTAGRVLTAGITAAGLIIGVALDAAAATATTIRMLIQPR